ncbi:MAG: FAD binding domain-containing protein, partial [Actinomycetota bacterium]|nr:FAD binding domain-containing protein [Actinomycetota bacterium]
MIPAEFEYELAESGEQALQLLEQHGDEAKLLAGGHSLLPLMKLRLATPSMLIDIGRLDDMSYIRDDGDAIAIGALTRHEVVEGSDVLKQHCAIVAHTAGEIGDPQVRHF